MISLTIVLFCAILPFIMAAIAFKLFCKLVDFLVEKVLEGIFGLPIRIRDFVVEKRKETVTKNKSKNRPKTGKKVSK